MPKKTTRPKKYRLRKYIVVVDRNDKSYATSFDITDKHPRQVDKLEDGLFRKVDFDRFYVETIRRKHPPEVRR